MNKDNTKEVITWAAENGDGQSLQGLIDGLAEFMITIDFNRRNYGNNLTHFCSSPDVPRGEAFLAGAFLRA